METRGSGFVVGFCKSAEHDLGALHFVFLLYPHTLIFSCADNSPSTQN